MRAAGESRPGDGRNLATAAEGERVAGAVRISQAEGPRAGGRPGEFGRLGPIGADGVTLSGWGQGGKSRRSPETGGIAAWRDSHRTPRPTYRRCWGPSGSK